MNRTAVMASAVGALLWSSAYLPVADAAQGSNVEPKARSILMSASHFLQNATSLQLKAQATSEEVSSTNEKIQLDSTMSLTIMRPSKIFLEKSGYENFSLWYDGTTVTVLDRISNKYARIPFQGMLFELGDKLDEYGIDAPFAGLFNSTLDSHITNNVQEARYQGETMILDTKCQHVALRQSDVDWQIWVDKTNGAPRKVTITSKTLTGSPEYQVVIRDLKVDGTVASDFATFRAPAGSEEVPIKSFGGSTLDNQ